MANITDLQNIAETVRALISQVGQQLSSIFGRLALTGKRNGDVFRRRSIFIVSR